MNPLQEHLAKQETIGKQKNIIGYCLAFCIGLIVCYLIMRGQISLRTKEEET